MGELKRKNRNLETAAILFGVAAGMVGLAFASVPLYQLFCRVTGYGGATQKVAFAPNERTASRKIVVRFDANVNPKLPWSFKPDRREIVTATGVETLATYTATNTSDRALVGTATFNVTPYKAGLYFSKVQCFCFTEQKLEPGETAAMPVSFYVEPAIDEDPNARDVKTITLSYTFFKAPDQRAALKTAIDGDGS